MTRAAGPENCEKNRFLSEIPYLNFLILLLTNIRMTEYPLSCVQFESNDAIAIDKIKSVG